MLCFVVFIVNFGDTDFEFTCKSKVSLYLKDEMFETRCYKLINLMFIMNHDENSLESK